MKKVVILSVFSAIFTLLVIAYVCGFYIYRSCVGYYISPQGEIELSEISGNTVSIMSYNIKCDFPASTDEERQNSWKNRAECVSEILNTYKPPIIGMQEVKRSQAYYMNRFLIGYKSVLVYRENTPLAESTPIFYREDLFELVKTETFWLSETPQTVSISWGSKYHRICTFAVLKDKRTNMEFLVANTHLDNGGDSITINQMKVILSKIQDYNLPTLLMGDMNSRIETKTIKEAKTVMSDLGEGCDEEYAGTVNLFDYSLVKFTRKIDWIFQTPNAFTVNKYKIVQDKVDGRYPSDHFPIYAEIMFNS